MKVADTRKETVQTFILPIKGLLMDTSEINFLLAAYRSRRAYARLTQN